jgi:hypothetical protein
MHKFLKRFALYTTITISLIFISVNKAGSLQTEKVTSHLLGEYSGFKLEGNIKRFVGETLYIDVSFLWFDNAAIARVGLYEENGILHSILEAETKGFVGFFTNYRKHYYKATFDLVNKENRLRTKTFERKVIIGEVEDVSSHSFDYKNRIHKWEKFIDGKLIEDGNRAIPPGISFDDILAVFYNFRNSVYGEIQKGAKYTIHTIPKKLAEKIDVNIINQKKQKELMSRENRTNNSEYLIQANISKEIFNTETGELLFWASDHLIPLETKIMDYILFGDLHAKLNRRVFSSAKTDVATPHSSRE